MRPIISEVLRETAGQPEKVIRKALRDAWDDAGFGERAMWPYRTWCSEVQYQRGFKQPKRRGRPARTAPAPDERQMTLF
jgi:hypothetical protein